MATEQLFESGVAALLRASMREPVIWSPPVEFDLSNSIDRNELVHAFEVGTVQTVQDPVLDVADELFEYSYPSEVEDSRKRAAFVADITAQGNSYGRWFLLPWSHELVRYPDKDTHRSLRTSRNRDLITAAEQAKLYGATVADFGLSVGSNVVESLVSSGIGGKLIIGDPDTISPSNLNRINADFRDVGMAKIDYVACKVSAIDPYIVQVHFRDGLSDANIDDLRAHNPDVVFDEVDNLSIKAKIRQFGQETKTPVVMATDLGDRSLIDVERHDRAKTKPFGGRLKPAEFAKLANGNFTDAEKMKYMMKIVGLRHVTTRVLSSAMQTGDTLAGLPQLGTTADIGGGLAAIAAREIILGRRMATGRYVNNTRRLLGLKPQGTIKHTKGVVADFVRFTKSKKA